MADIRTLRDQLAAARSRLDSAMRALAPRHKGGEVEEFREARAELLRCEREVAAAQGEEFAVPLGFPHQWDTGAPLPHLMVNDHRALLSFLVSDPDPNWDGTHVTQRDPGDGTAESIALVEFDGCVSAKLGAPNDEVLRGHPLSGRGQEGYTAQVVSNSRWLRELEAINSVHPRFRPETWRDLQHYVFWFHDSTFECVARSYRVETFRESVPAVLARMTQRLIL